VIHAGTENLIILAFAALYLIWVRPISEFFSRQIPPLLMAGTRFLLAGVSQRRAD
jgi:hypothetical protein